MEFGWKRLNRQIDEYQSELVQTHYAGGGTTTATISRR